MAARNGSSAVEVAADDRQVEMGVHGRVAVPGEVLRARGDALPLRALDERGDVPGNELGVGAEAADPDHRVVRVHVHVRDRREVQVHAGARRARPRSPRRRPLGQLDVVDDAEREIARVGAAADRLEPGDVAALLVDRRRGRPAPPAAGGQRRELLGVADVVGEEA